MALAALHLLGHVKSTWAAAFRGLYALAVDDAGRRRRLAPDGLTRAPDETAIDAMPSPVVPLTVEVALHGRARRKFSPELPPLTAGSKNVKNGIHYGSQIRRSWASYASRRRHQRLQQRPFRVCRVACKAKAVAPILQASDFSPRHGALHRISQIRRNHIRLKSLTSFSARLSGLSPPSAPPIRTRFQESATPRQFAPNMSMPLAWPSARISRASCTEIFSVIMTIFWRSGFTRTSSATPSRTPDGGR